MELNYILQLYDYNRWAGHRTLTIAKALAIDDFLRPMGNSFSSVRDTLADPKNDLNVTHFLE